MQEFLANFPIKFLLSWFFIKMGAPACAGASFSNLDTVVSGIKIQRISSAVAIVVMALKISHGVTSMGVLGILTGAAPLVRNLKVRALRRATPKIKIRFTRIPGGSFSNSCLSLSPRVEKNCDTAITVSACSFLFMLYPFLIRSSNELQAISFAASSWSRF